MRVIIICDMEGVSCINHWDQVQAGGYLYEEGRVLYTGEVNAAIRGARDAGATEIVVLDGHGAGQREACCKFNSIKPDLLDPAAEFVSHQRYLDYDAILRGGFDAAFFVGIHSREGTPNGVLSHTIATSVWSNIWFNDTLVGEIGVMSALAGHHGIPMAMIAGDEAACREARDLLGEPLVTAAVKKGLSRFSARHLAPSRAQALIEERATEALRLAAAGRFQPWRLDGPVTVRYEIKSIDKIDELFRGRPGVVIDDQRLMVKTTADTWHEAWYRLYPW